MTHRGWVIRATEEDGEWQSWARSPYGVWETAARAGSKERALEAGKAWVSRVIERHYPKWQPERSDIPLGRYPPPTTEPTRRPGQPAWSVFRPGRRLVRRRAR